MKNILLIILPFLFLCSCSTVHKIFHENKSATDTASSVQVNTLQVKENSNDSSATEDVTDSSRIETGYEKKTVAEDYFVPVDSSGKINIDSTRQHVLYRKTTTYEKGNTKEQKNIRDKKTEQHQSNSKELNAKDSSGTTASHHDERVTDNAINKKGPSFTFGIVWLVILLIFLYVFFRYLVPAFKAMFIIPPL